MLRYFSYVVYSYICMNTVYFCLLGSLVRSLDIDQISIGTEKKRRRKYQLFNQTHHSISNAKQSESMHNANSQIDMHQAKTHQDLYTYNRNPT